MAATLTLDCSCLRGHKLGRRFASKLKALKLRMVSWCSSALTGSTAEHAFVADLQHRAVWNASDICLPLGCAANAQLRMFPHSMLNDLCRQCQSCSILLLLRQQGASCKVMSSSAFRFIGSRLGASKILSRTEAARAHPSHANSPSRMQASSDGVAKARFDLKHASALQGH